MKVAPIVFVVHRALGGALVNGFAFWSWRGVGRFLVCSLSFPRRAQEELGREGTLLSFSFFRSTQFSVASEEGRDWKIFVGVGAKQQNFRTHPLEICICLKFLQFFGWFEKVPPLFQEVRTQK